MSVYGMPVAECDAKQVRSLSLSEQMEDRKRRLEMELAEVNKVIDGLSKNPEAADLLNAISRLGGLRGY